MKKLANPASMQTVMISMTRIPMFAADANGELLSPKHTGHANAERGVATSASAIASRCFVFRWNRAAYTISPAAAMRQRTAAMAYVMSCCARYWLVAHAATNAAITIDSAMKTRWKILSDISMRGAHVVHGRANLVHVREERHEHEHDEEEHRQQQRAVDRLLFVAEMHEHAGHHRPFHHRDDERHRD